MTIICRLFARHFIFINRQRHQQDMALSSSEEVPLVAACFIYLGFYVLMFVGYINNLFFKPNLDIEKYRDGYVPLYNIYERIYIAWLYRRVRDCWNRPICSIPGGELTLKDRISNDKGWTFEFTGTETTCLNLASFNYLGFAENSGVCAENSIETLREFGLAACSPRRELGSRYLHIELEQLTAEFLGVEDSIVFGMGFATNALNLPAVLSPGCLALSDDKNHASIILGLRLSGATIRVFKHNNMQHLEKQLEDAIFKGQPKNGTPWKKILIVAEGVFSMEGSIVKLPEILALKKKYKAYLYLDEAHSIGALGPRGRGVADYFGVNPSDVDILMGTFSKSFASSGGYIAGSKHFINFLRAHSHAHCYGTSMSPPIAQQILSSMKIIMGLDGTNEGQRRFNQLARNTIYFRRRLGQIGVITYGHEDSPVVPMLVYSFSKVVATVRTLTKRNIAVVGVGFPATPMMGARIRFCLSASHTKEQLDFAVKAIDDASDAIGLKYLRKRRSYDLVEY